MKSLLVLHKKNRESASILRGKFSSGKINENNYRTLQNRISKEAMNIETEMYTYIEEKEIIINQFKRIAGMISVIYAMGLIAFIYEWAIK